LAEDLKGLLLKVDFERTSVEVGETSVESRTTSIGIRETPVEIKKASIERARNADKDFAPEARTGRKQIHLQEEKF
jgi:hypothetical protein